MPSIRIDDDTAYEEACRLLRTFEEETIGQRARCTLRMRLVMLPFSQRDCVSQVPTLRRRTLGGRWMSDDYSTPTVSQAWVTKVRWNDRGIEVQLDNGNVVRVERFAHPLQDIDLLTLSVRHSDHSGMYPMSMTLTSDCVRGRKL
jgi:hypothetical protein